MVDDDRSESAQHSSSSAAVALDTIPLHSTNLLSVLDETGVIKYESPAIECIFGFEQDELVGEQIDQYLHPDDRKAIFDAFQTVVTSDAHTVESVEYRHRTADETYMWVESVASSDPTPEGYYVVNTRDISERKARERRLERTNERLEEFAYVVSHDLRNPLQVAQGRMEVLREKYDDEQLEVIEQAHQRMNRLIDNLLTLARDGDQISETEAVDLGDLSETCWQNIETTDATMRVEIDRTITADRSRLEQLVENLMRNAIEHGGEDVTVTVGPLDDGFYVADDGPGIPVDKRHEVFEIGHSTIDSGTGFGLAIVEQVAQAHGWTIEVTDGTDGGARFEFHGVTVPT